MTMAPTHMAWDARPPPPKCPPPLAAPPPVAPLAPSSALPDFSANYSLGRKLGSGGFAVVRLCYSTEDGAQRAVKMQRVQQDALEENDLLQGIDHPNIIRTYGLYYHGYVRDAFCMVMDCCACDLLQALQGCSASLMPGSGLLRQMAASVGHLHQRSIIHCDVKEFFLLGRQRDPQAFVTLTCTIVRCAYLCRGMPGIAASSINVLALQKMRGLPG